jgi:hypothetical protein
MKKIGEYTARGVVPGASAGAGTPIELNLFDGRFDTGYVVKEFKIWSTDYGSDSAADCIGKLSKSGTSSTAAASFFRADDDNEIAWATSEGASQSGNDAGLGDAILDPNNLTIEDLYVYARSATSDDINYMITMEKYSFSEWRGALAMAVDAADGE